MCFSCICLFVLYVLVFVIFLFLFVSGVGCGFLQQDISEPEFYGDLVYRIRKLWGNLIFRNNSESLLNVIKEKDIIHMLCDRLHAQLLTQPRLIAMLHSLIARRRVGPQSQ